MEKKRKSMVYRGLGFPLRLINVPMRKVYGKWVFDFSMGEFQEAVLRMIATKQSLLTAAEIRFIMDYFELSYRDFAKLLGVSHAAVVKWEKGKSKMNPHTEISLRLYILNSLKISDKEFRKWYLELSKHRIDEDEASQSLLDIDIDKIAC